uniref:Putative secreted protein n=1 Tax=Amblyomma americanum TaxID=6943 RepID=A0A0C9SDW3_AMBAM
MFFTFAAAAVAGVFFSMGFSNPTPTNSVRGCPPPSARFKNGTIIVVEHTRNCTCDLGGGAPGNYTEGTPCFAENSGQYKIGNCSGGVCKVKQTSYGCEGMKGGENGTTVHKNLCIFDCDINGRKEWAYSPVGTPCVNEDEDPYNTTCKKTGNGNETLCVENIHPYGC